MRERKGRDRDNTETEKGRKRGQREREAEYRREEGNVLRLRGTRSNLTFGFNNLLLGKVAWWKAPNWQAKSKCFFSAI